MYIIHGNYVITLELSIMYTFNFYCKRKIRTFPTPIVHMVHSLIMMRNYRTTECGWLMLLAFYSLGYVLYFPARETTSSFSWICINASMNCPPVLNHYEFRRQEVFRFYKHVAPEVGKAMSYLPSHGVMVTFQTQVYRNKSSLTCMVCRVKEGRQEW